MRFVRFKAILVWYKEAPDWTSGIIYYFLLFHMKIFGIIFCKLKILIILMYIQWNYYLPDNLEKTDFSSDRRNQ